MKFRITLTAEYEVHPENYPEGSTPDAMLDIDLEEYREDPFNLADMLLNLEDMRRAEITGEIVEG